MPGWKPVVTGGSAPKELTGHTRIQRGGLALKSLRRVLFMILILSSAFILSCSTPGASAENQSFTAFCDRLLKDLLQDDPETITSLGNLESAGIPPRDGELTDVSRAAMQRWFNTCRQGLTTLQAMDRTPLSPVQQANADALAWYLNDQVQREPFFYHEYPAEPIMYGIHLVYPDFMINYCPITDKQSAENYISRLTRCGTRFDQAVEILKTQEKKGITMPQFLVDLTLNQVYGFTRVDPDQNVLYTNLESKIAALSSIRPSDKKSICDGALKAIEKSVYPAYRRLQEYLVGLRPRARRTAGVWDLPDGDAYYRYILRHHLSTDLTPEEVHTIGLAEVARIQNEMMAVFKELGMSKPTVAENLTSLAISDEVFYDPDDILNGYRGLVAEIEGWLPEYFDMLPKMKVDIRPQPPFMGPATAHFYSAGSLDGTRPGYFGVNTKYPNALRDMKLTVCHETVPGHHLQIALQGETEGIPLIRRSPLTNCNGFMEGWALYAERLAVESGFIKTPQERFAALWSEYYRAIRLVVDTGIHYKRWTRQQAIDYMVETTGSQRAYEVDRYIVMPGQACSYKIGQLKMLELRERVRRALGERFDIKEFHRVVLQNGAVPLVVLENEVQRYIDSKK